jgi:hypothetical protein
VNPQTAEFCALIGIPNRVNVVEAMTVEFQPKEVISPVTSTTEKAEIVPKNPVNPDEIQLDTFSDDEPRVSISPVSEVTTPSQQHKNPDEIELEFSD